MFSLSHIITLVLFFRTGHASSVLSSEPSPFHRKCIERRIAEISDGVSILPKLFTDSAERRESVVFALDELKQRLMVGDYLLHLRACVVLQRFSSKIIGSVNRPPKIRSLDNFVSRLALILYYDADFDMLSIPGFLDSSLQSEVQRYIHLLSLFEFGEYDLKNYSHGLPFDLEELREINSILEVSDTKLTKYQIDNPDNLITYYPISILGRILEINDRDARLTLYGTLRSKHMELSDMDIRFQKQTHSTSFGLATVYLRELDELVHFGFLDDTFRYLLEEKFNSYRETIIAQLEALSYYEDADAVTSHVFLHAFDRVLRDIQFPFNEERIARFVRDFDRMVAQHHRRNTPAIEEFIKNRVPTESPTNYLVDYVYDRMSDLVDFVSIRTRLKLISDVRRIPNFSIDDETNRFQVAITHSIVEGFRNAITMNTRKRICRNLYPIKISGIEKFPLTKTEFIGEAISFMSKMGIDILSNSKEAFADESELIGRFEIITRRFLDFSLTDINAPNYYASNIDIATRAAANLEAVKFQRDDLVLEYLVQATRDSKVEIVEMPAFVAQGVNVVHQGLDFSELFGPLCFPAGLIEDAANFVQGAFLNNRVKEFEETQLPKALALFYRGKVSSSFVQLTHIIPFLWIKAVLHPFSRYSATLRPLAELLASVIQREFTHESGRFKSSQIPNDIKPAQLVRDLFPSTHSFPRDYASVMNALVQIKRFLGN